MNELSQQIRLVLNEGGTLPVDATTLNDSDDLYAVGLTSHATVNLMLGLEERFDVEFPDRLLRRRTFESIDAISAAVNELLATKKAA
ncbi:MAG: acyl carrier protein [Alphaproteobacteria bacterium]|nr:acyl carrier protein [Alphaproteobacteria bacterium]